MEEHTVLAAESTEKSAAQILGSLRGLFDASPIRTQSIRGRDLLVRRPQMKQRKTIVVLTDGIEGCNEEFPHSTQLDFSLVCFPPEIASGCRQLVV
jgi:hypothetical protein